MIGYLRPVVLVLVSALALLLFGSVSQATPAASESCSEQFSDRNEAAGYDHRICLTPAAESELKVVVRGDCKWNYGGWFWGKPPSKCRTSEARYTLTAPDAAKSNVDMSTMESVDGRVEATGKSFKCAEGTYKVDLYYKIEMMGLAGKWSRQLEHQRAVDIKAAC
ncbi:MULTISPECIES: hypothetical protein [unclassified Crossiella]|uniref:hypothetical protein n=1 Tax=unclassified Crossiella TaxID=2620835 RepID=UPI0020002080|nr:MULTISPECIES: hypothetical protein [unclassified Crossiella]MCK2236525.1 hypothetical protein [Crossiella sp. S99.2]MCK2250192.1 hypothetical protein [Crossiella sp. S99.1]